MLDDGAVRTTTTMQDYGFLSIVPPILTIILALYTKNVIVALVLGVASGSLILTGFNPFDAAKNAVEEQILVEVSVPSQVQVIVTMMVIGGFVRVLDVSGGATAFARRMARIVSTRVKAQLLAWLAGLAVFFTASGSCLIVGPLFRSVFDEFRLCREKLAYILDTTASPISILIPITGWGAYIMSLIEKNYTTVGLTDDAFAVLISVIPYQFYAFLALLTVPMIILTRRDYGPMRRIQAEYDEALALPGSPTADAVAETEGEAEERLGLFLYPLGVMLLLVAGQIGWHWTHDGITGTHIRSTLIIAYLTASLTCMELMRRYQSKPYTESIAVFIKGVESLVYVCIVLVLAWSLSAITGDLGTAEYVASIIGGTVSPAVFPTLVFVLGAFISLSTGSSYGTFAIVMAIAAPVGVYLEASMLLTIAAVLSSGLLGDHCSPISDTTVLASFGADCNHLNHVTTQAAYAGLTGLVTVFALLLAGIYETPLVLAAAVLVLFIAVKLSMRFFGGPAHV